MNSIAKITILALGILFFACDEEEVSLKNISKTTTKVSINSSISHYVTSQYAFNGEILFPNTDDGKTSVDFLLENVEFFPKSEKTLALNGILDEKFNTAMSEAKKSYADAKLVIDDLGYGSIAIAYEMKISVPFIGEHHASVSTNKYTYTGGAHGMTTIDNSTYNLSTGKKVTLSDIFADVDNQELIQMMRGKLLSIRNKELYFDFDTIRLHENFIIQDGGLQFTYNQYDIAPYSEGITEIHFTFDEIRDFLREDSPIGHLF